MDVIQILGIAGAVIMPLWNIPLILRIIKRHSSEDISLWWAVGVWVCIVLMAPAGFVSADMVLKAFSMINLVLFSGVVVVVLIYKKKKQDW
jgi:uncharacterized protein with PQ loop repeat